MANASSLPATEEALQTTMVQLGEDARTAASELARASSDVKNRALVLAAEAIRQNSDTILAANDLDMSEATARGLSGALLDRLLLDDKRIEAMAKGLEDIAGLADPVGEVISEWDRPNGLEISRVRVPLGVIGVIYESRPNVTADAGGLCLKAGNAVILRGGSESANSSRAIHACLMEGCVAAGLPKASVQIVPTQDRAAVGIMLGMAGTIDVIIPRGGRSLIERVQNDSKVPVFAHLDGICHVYIDRDADADMARKIALNAKMRRTGICGAAETLLIDSPVAERILPSIADDLIEAGCELRGDGPAQAIDSRIIPATEQDWGTEYLDAIISVAVVNGVDDAVAHIASHGSQHTDTIVTERADTAEKFLNEVDSAIVMHNASTQFADGGEFGMGAEIGIATGKMHARGPVGVEQLTSFKYQVRGSGQTRP